MLNCQDIDGIKFVWFVFLRVFWSEFRYPEQGKSIRGMQSAMPCRSFPRAHKLVSECSPRHVLPQSSERLAGLFPVSSLEDGTVFQMCVERAKMLISSASSSHHCRAMGSHSHLHTPYQLHWTPSYRYQLWPLTVALWGFSVSED